MPTVSSDKSRACAGGNRTDSKCHLTRVSAVLVPPLAAPLSKGRSHDYSVLRSKRTRRVMGLLVRVVHHAYGSTFIAVSRSDDAHRGRRICAASWQTKRYAHRARHTVAAVSKIGAQDPK